MLSNGDPAGQMREGTSTPTGGIPLTGRLFIQLSQEVRNGLQIDLSGRDGYVLGRSDAKSEYLPDIDLAAFNALDRGVSRRHAALISYHDRLHILDLSSVNGTFLNGQRLTPETPYPINSGDQLTLGELGLTLIQLEK